MTNEELEQNKKDLGNRKADLNKQIDSILSSGVVSSKGKNRVISAMTAFPDRVLRLTDSSEAALVTLLYEVKNIQIAMFTIQSAIDQNNATTKGE